MRERFSVVSSFSLRRTSFFASLNGLMRPRLVILPRLRIMAVIGMRASSASHTATWLSHCVGMASRDRSNSSMSFRPWIRSWRALPARRLRRDHQRVQVHFQGRVAIDVDGVGYVWIVERQAVRLLPMVRNAVPRGVHRRFTGGIGRPAAQDRKSTRLNSSHVRISYA